jgi:hypothetical protein
MSTLKAKILAASDIKSESMTIPEWGVTIKVTGMSGRTREKFLEAVFQNGGGGDGEASKVATNKAMVPLINDFVVDGARDPQTGERLFTADDIDALREKNGETLQRIALKVISLSGLGEKAVETAQGNSSETPSGASS